MKKLFILTAAAIICAGPLAGCGGAFDAKNGESYMYAESGGANMAAPQAPADYDYDYGYHDEIYAYKYEYEAEDGFELALTSSTSSLPEGRKIIRDAEITMEVEDAELSYENILAFLTSLGGYETGRNMNSSSSNRYYSLANTATLKVPAANLDKFLAGLKEEGEVISSNISSADITEQYFDSQIKLTTLEMTLENYYRFLEEAQNIDEQLRITRYINDITREIEGLKGSLRRWDSLVEYSTVVLYMYRPYEAPVPEREINWNSLSFEDMGWFMSSGFLGVINLIFSAAQWILIALVTVSPVVAPIVVFIILMVRRHRKKTKQNKNYPVYNQGDNNNA